MPDAFLIPTHYPAGKRDVDRLLALNAEFGPPLDAKVVQVAHVHLGGRIVDLVRARSDAPGYFFPKGHPKEGRDRYEWSDRGDGVSEGVLVAEGADDAN